MICLSFDTDHLDDSRMSEFLAEVPIPGAGTFFCTQVYDSIDPTTHELCPHPTLGAGDDWEARLDEAQRAFPSARGFRAHGCVWSHPLSVELRARGFEYVSAHDQLGWPGITPYREAWGLWHLPIYYMDNMDLSYARFWKGTSRAPFERALLEGAAREPERLFVFDFHPIHLLLNSTSVDAYMAARDAFRAGRGMAEIRCEGYGVHDYYMDLLELMGARDMQSVTMSDAVAQLAHEATT